LPNSVQNVNRRPIDVKSERASTKPMIPVPYVTTLTRATALQSYLKYNKHSRFPCYIDFGLAHEWESQPEISCTRATARTRS
jgi:hypothetical protein